MEPKKPRKPRRKDAVLNVLKDGEYITAQFVVNGEVVIGEYKRIGWARPPRAVAEEFNRILRSPPIAVFDPRKRAAKARRRTIDPKEEV